VLSGDFGALALAHSLAALWHGLRIAYARCASWSFSDQATLNRKGEN
jgi:hypothetical protein